MKKAFLLLSLTIVTLLIGCGPKKSQAYYDYKTKVIGTELDGSYTLRSWGRARNAADAYVQAHKQAVYDVLFTGVEPASNGQSYLKPLIFEPNAREKYEDYFNAFFADGGEYKKFASIKEKRVLSSNYARTDVQSICETTVCVWRTKLRAKLIEDGIIKK
ncbi:MAG: hypothetical protein J6Q47_04475 [Paludibacteraceae bacterium]|nr:hypothetical protein [Paludibacteraceae bacterium]